MATPDQKPDNATPIVLSEHTGGVLAEVAACVVMGDAITGGTATDQDISDALLDYEEQDTPENVAAVRAIVDKAK